MSRYPQVFLDFQIGTQAAGRVIFELFNDVTPKTAENFRGLCTGEYGNVGMAKKTKKLHYLNTNVFRIADNMLIQGGDIINNDGTGGASIYSQTFVDENFSRRHACAGLLSMANRGRNTNNSQFFITLKPCPHLDGKHVVFGQVIDGIEVIKRVGQVPVDMQDRPRIPVIIINCGEVSESKNWLICDPFKKEIMDEIHRDRLKALYGQEYLDELDKEEEQKLQALNPEKFKQQSLENEEESNKQLLVEQLLQKTTEDQEQEDDSQENLDQFEGKKFMTQKHKDRYFELKKKIQQSKVLNDKAVLNEERQNTDAQYDKNLRKGKYLQKKEAEKQELQFKQIDEDKDYLNRMTVKHDEEQEKKKEYFGWDVFNEDAVYNAYKKRCTTLAKNEGKYKQQMESNQEFVPTNEALERLSSDITKQQDRRKEFSRRRRFNEDQPVTYINERNRIFNKKLERFFGDYAADIKANLERGTAS
ncbi:unnamed protein product (macronuclear) [Paramecium tetraurelia]|uniref:peptidylprolyl isomerase n=1 Tax=Paramecium tetraurelia TaxID=5888 RepID=A0BD35_PARTE|nr:uncharacterized protein GSPATT00004546001 [Paramecium tetraurelia]CAK56452.1 unnamed protein product [Paramecium tetraurelia]|eukprot:XP_001423850.1 hypothetical protein (macronuclear) [Paramecium tetraurelia strain d4-2]